MQHFIQPIKAEDLPVEDFAFIKAQNAIFELGKSVRQNAELKSQINKAKSTEEFLKISAENGYEFTIADLEFAINWAFQKNQLNSDELDDYELSEEELETVAGGTVAGRAMTVNSYWHVTGILVNQQCFHLLEQSTEARSQLETALETMELWFWKGNGNVEVVDADGKYKSYLLTNMAYDGLAPSLIQDTSNKETYSSNNLLLGLVL